jgi:hypothetical protein
MVGKERTKDFSKPLKTPFSPWGKGEKAFGATSCFSKTNENNTIGPKSAQLRYSNQFLLSKGPRRDCRKRKNGTSGCYTYKDKFSLVPHYVDDIARGLVKKKGMIAH